jgi:hypothetical protein
MKGTLKIKISQGKPNREDFHKIISMLFEGYTSGISEPNGITWDSEMTGEMYDTIGELM